MSAEEHKLVHVERTDGTLIPACVCGWYSHDGSHWRFEAHVARHAVAAPAVSPETKSDA